MPIIGVVGGETVQQILPDRARIEHRIDDLWQKYLASKPPLVTRKEDGSIDLDAARRAFLLFLHNELNQVAYPTGGPDLIDEPGGFLDALLHDLIGAAGDAGKIAGRPIIAQFLDP